MADNILSIQADLLKALGHPARLKVLELLAQQETCVCDLIPAVGIEQSNLSQHLQLLKKHGVVETRKDGTRVIYRLANPEVQQVMASARAAVQSRLESMALLVSRTQG